MSTRTPAEPKLPGHGPKNVETTIDNVKRVNPLLRPLAKLVLKLAGWKVQGSIPDDTKLVGIFAHHTSNWDGFIGLTMRYAIEDRRVAWVSKDTTYRFPFRKILDWLGCIPIQRNNPEGLVDQVAQAFLKHDYSILAIAPEGTRHSVKRWKTGFYRIAERADCRIVLAFLDYRRKIAGVGPTITPSGDYDADMKIIMDFYKNVTPKHPDRIATG